MKPKKAKVKNPLDEIDDDTPSSIKKMILGAREIPKRYFNFGDDDCIYLMIHRKGLFNDEVRIYDEQNLIDSLLETYHMVRNHNGGSAIWLQLAENGWVVNNNVVGVNF
jgi:hypothetical protein